jgi:predicted short-subunit dehydrogenase-like oxidoreductase (DUF2520 family)
VNFGQVPRTSALAQPIGIVGDGRVARHFAHYFGLKRIPVRQTHRKNQLDYSVLADCRSILLLVSDPAIEPIARDVQALFPKKPLLHFSGSLVTPLARGVHPLMTFGPELYDPSLYASIAFVGECEEEYFRLLFPELENPYFKIAPEKKALYHSLCVIGGNFTAFLWTKLFEDFKNQLDLPPEAAIPYLKQVAQNLADHPQNPRSTWTGPIARQDAAAVGRNLAALEGDAFQPIYQEFVRAFAPELATERSKK